jgi:hypothetical protein
MHHIHDLKGSEPVLDGISAYTRCGGHAVELARCDPETWVTRCT